MNEPAKIRVLSIDDHPLVREGLAALINSQTDMCVVAQGSTGHEAIKFFRELHPDVALMDVRLPDMSGIDAMITILSGSPQARVIMVTSSEGDVEIERALPLRAHGHLRQVLVRRKNGVAQHSNLEADDILSQCEAGNHRPRVEALPRHRRRAFGHVPILCGHAG